MAGAGAGRVVIAGGTGFVGGEVVRLFERLGYTKRSSRMRERERESD